jgi:hypothetical protein
VNVCVLVAVPPAFVTVTGPVVAPAGTVALMEWMLSTWNEALTPLKLTAVVLMRLLPFISTVEPTLPLVELSSAMAGAGAGRPASRVQTLSSANSWPLPEIVPPS